jgi:hypothetical protein
MKFERDDDFFSEKLDFLMICTILCKGQKSWQIVVSNNYRPSVAICLMLFQQEKEASIQTNKQIASSIGSVKTAEAVS